MQPINNMMQLLDRGACLNLAYAIRTIANAHGFDLAAVDPPTWGSSLQLRRPHATLTITVPRQRTSHVLLVEKPGGRWWVSSFTGYGYWLPLEYEQQIAGAGGILMETVTTDAVGHPVEVDWPALAWVRQKAEALGRRLETAQWATRADIVHIK